MATGSRTLTLKLLADIADFTSNLSKGSKHTQSFADEVSAFGKKAALAFAAAGAAVGTYVTKVVENAARDQAAQRQLALTLQNTTNATQSQISAVEGWINKTSIAIGITDDQLRPAFARLTRSTNDVQKAQDLLNLSMDISAATGKPLETVANALGKAYDGNSSSLGRLGLGLDANTLKSKDFDAIFKQLTGTFGNFAENEARSTEAQMRRVRIALDEANESIGAALLPVVQKLTAWLLEHFVPALQATIGGLTGDKSVLKSLKDTYGAFYDWGERIRGLIDLLISFKEEIIVVAGVMGTMFVASKIAAGVTATITAINLLIKAYNALKASAFVAGVAAAFAMNPALGVAAGVAGTAAIIAATKFIEGIGGGQEVDTTNLGNFQMSTGTVLGGGGASGGGGGYGGGSGTSYNIGTGGYSASQLSGGLITSPSDLISKLTSTSEAISAIEFGYTSGQLTKAQASAQLAKQQAVFANLSNIAENLGASSSLSSTANQASAARYQAAANYYVNVTGAIDPEGTARTIVNTLNNSYYRGTGGAGNLIND